MTSTYEPNVVLATKTYDVVGTRPIRHDGADKVTGRAKYGADFHTAGLLYAKMLRSPHAHARIKSIDTSKAEAHPGVRAVVTAKDWPPVTGEGVVQLGELTTTLKYLRDEHHGRAEGPVQGAPDSRSSRIELARGRGGHRAD